MEGRPPGTVHHVHTYRFTRDWNLFVSPNVVEIDAFAPLPMCTQGIVGLFSYSVDRLCGPLSLILQISIDLLNKCRAVHPPIVMYHVHAAWLFE